MLQAAAGLTSGRRHGGHEHQEPLPGGKTSLSGKPAGKRVSVQAIGKNPFNKDFFIKTILIITYAAYIFLYLVHIYSLRYNNFNISGTTDSNFKTLIYVNSFWNPIESPLHSLSRLKAGFLLSSSVYLLKPITL